MDLTKILTISGKSGLYKLLANNKNNIIVEALKDKRRYPIFSNEKISSLEEISIYTETGDIPLKDVFVLLYKHTKHQPVDQIIIKDNKLLYELFNEFLPEYDKDLVFHSHMKKICQWYNELLSVGIINEEVVEENNEKIEEEDKNSQENSENKIEK
ncbi:MAG: DUF5606 domain-containing protein [Bacteroidales bacterium]|jgi:hypothetical protein